MGKISVKVVKLGHLSYPTGCMKNICCDQTVGGTFWRAPVLNIDGSIAYYSMTPILNDDGTELPPTTDSYKVVEVNACGVLATVAIDNAQTSAILATACNICCGDAPVDLDVTIPSPIIEVRPCADAAGDRKVSVAYPAGASLALSGTFDGVAGTPAASGGNPHASGAAILIWLNANWSAYGTWSHDAVNKIITLTLDVSVTSAGLQIVVP